ncbi:hypothetical protein HG530_007202 [Fusarium avenaceum]|nr:hypothetical protein HG530_007202 [Fusarium avenaceum]
MARQSPASTSNDTPRSTDLSERALYENSRLSSRTGSGVFSFCFLRPSFFDVKGMFARRLTTATTAVAVIAFSDASSTVPPKSVLACPALFFPRLRGKCSYNSDVEEYLGQSSTRIFCTLIAARLPLPTDNGVAFDCAHNDRQRRKSDEREFPGYDEGPDNSGDDHDGNCDDDRQESTNDVAHLFSIPIKAFVDATRRVA